MKIECNVHGSLEGPASEISHWYLTLRKRPTRRLTVGTRWGCMLRDSLGIPISHPYSTLRMQHTGSTILQLGRRLTVF